MKRDVPVNGKFDIDAFADILLLAKNNKTLRDFSKDCGLSEGYLSRYIHKKTLTPPSVKTLTYIAGATTNPYVTLDKLLAISGYKYGEELEKSKNYKEFNIIQSTIDGLIKNATASLGYWPSAEREDYQDYIDYPMVRGTEYFDYSASDLIERKDPKFWGFNYVSLKNNSIFSLDTQIAALFGNIVTINLPKNGKYSFVTYDSITYKALTQTEPVLLPIYVSVIFVDITKGKISKEKYLKTGIPEPSKEFKKRINLIGTT